MARFSGDATTAGEADSPTTPANRPEGERNDFYDIIGKIIDIGVKIVGTPIYVIAKILDNFVRHDGTGIKILGGALLVGGVVLSSDGFFQAFGGKPLFPWWEDTWIGIGWLWVWTKVNFWAAVVVSLAVQWIESQAIRGKDPDEAKVSYDQIKHHQTPAKNPNAIDLVEVRRKDYKRAGMGERSILGLFILFVFILDLGATFNGRNPWGQPPTEFIGILIYNTCTMLAGETGFALWRKANGKN
ncbi:MAG: hypothetical protein ICV63_00515 [Coleofasciculus sp. Co-bin14]|nr:hypothetical protein [Coleofasciculus sp. Co-bin14]